MKNGDRVNTPDGPGVVVDVEALQESGKTILTGRYGVLHDVFPVKRPRMYENDILYYQPRELSEEAIK